MPGPSKDKDGRSALERYLASLVERHRRIDARIESEAARGWSPSLKRLKRMRLALKDRIAMLSRRRAAMS